LLEQLLTERELSKLLGRSVASLQKDRVAGRGVPFVKLGPRMVRYHSADVASYIAGLARFRSTSQVDDNERAA
jgi:hypothetical protein